jgi:Pup amidohydrolase
VRTGQARGLRPSFRHASRGARRAAPGSGGIRLYGMSARRVMGIETEYGISVPGQPGANAMVSSSQVVNAYQAATAARVRRARWDFEEENPLRDARGFDLAAEAGDSAQLTDEDLGLANVILTNGARLYVDHAHPEYSAPECTNPLDAVIWDKAGERVMAEAATRAAALPGGPAIQLYKNNTDNKGASYGCHENYLMNRSTPFADIVRHLTPFFVSRQVVCGAGRVGRGADGRDNGFQISQRADFFEVEVGLETTLKRPIINTRDEPHADPDKYRRLHVILGDANLSEISTYLKLGTTALVLAMIEDRFLASDLSVESPVAELRAISHDPSLRHLVKLRDGRKMTAVQLQMEYLELARKFSEDKYGTDVDDITSDVLGRWESVLSRLAEDPMLTSRELDWVAKLEILEGYRTRDGLDWGHPRLELVDLQYADVRADRGLYNRLASRGRMTRLVSEQDVVRAMDEPPVDTRAYFRGRCLRKYPDAVAAASWDSVIFDIPGRESLQRVPTLEPLRGTRAHVGGLLERCETAAELVAALTGQD